MMLSLFCALTKHNVMDGAIQNGKYHFGRCSRCGVDMVRMRSGWQRVPKGFRVVWKPRDTSGSVQGQAAFAQTVNLHGVTVLGERRYGAQRFALVALNPRDRRDYRSMTDEAGQSGAIASKVETRLFAKWPLSVQARKRSGRQILMKRAQSS